MLAPDGPAKQVEKGDGKWHEIAMPFHGIPPEECRLESIDDKLNLDE
jgi:hypothetical protein